MSDTIEFYFDFGSPTTYLAHKRLQQLTEQYDVAIDYKPVLLGGLFQATSNASPVTVPAKGAWMNIDLARYAERYQVPLQMNPFFPVNTINLMRGALVAKEMAVFDQYTDAVFNAMWRDAKNMGDLEVVATVLNEAGLDAQGIIEATQNPEIKEALKSCTANAVERGLFGAPTLFHNGDFYFGQDRIFFIEEQLAVR
jgi:2-hydroxychromene-2-carboxylate isomerase